MIIDSSFLSHRAAHEYREPSMSETRDDAPTISENSKRITRTCSTN